MRCGPCYYGSGPEELPRADLRLRQLNPFTNSPPHRRLKQSLAFWARIILQTRMCKKGYVIFGYFDRQGYGTLDMEYTHGK